MVISGSSYLTTSPRRTMTMYSVYCTPSSNTPNTTYYDNQAYNDVIVCDVIACVRLSHQGDLVGVFNLKWPHGFTI